MTATIAEPDTANTVIVDDRLHSALRMASASARCAGTITAVLARVLLLPHEYWDWT